MNIWFASVRSTMGELRLADPASLSGLHTWLYAGTHPLATLGLV